jgi:hypothetical protein
MPYRPSDSTLVQLRRRRRRFLGREQAQVARPAVEAAVPTPARPALVLVHSVRD